MSANAITDVFKPGITFVGGLSRAVNPNVKVAEVIIMGRCVDAGNPGEAFESAESEISEREIRNRGAHTVQPSTALSPL